MVEDAQTALENQFVALRTRWWRIHEQHLKINSLRSGLDGGGYMKDNQFMGFRIRFDYGGCTNSARQSIRGTPNSMVKDG